jgi:hypothetical protein
MKLWVIGISAFLLFWVCMFLSDYILKKIRRPKIIGFLFVLLAVLIGFEFYDKNQLIAGASIFVGFAGARILMK